MKQLILIVITIILVCILAIGCDLFSSNQGGGNPIQDSYEIGDRGPANGIIFYDKGDSIDGWQYLEVAPYDMQQYNGEPILDYDEGNSYAFKFGYHRTSDGGNNVYVDGSDTYSDSSTKLGIGEGPRNTT